MTQQALPQRDFSVIEWTPIPVFSKINAQVFNDGSYVSCFTDRIAVFEVMLSNLAWPQIGTQTVNVRIRRTNSTDSFSVLVLLLQGAKTITTRTITLSGPDTTFHTESLNLTPDEIAQITDYIDLRVKVISGASGTQTFTTSGTWTVPPGVTSLLVECWGTGGDGQAATELGGGGGGGGAYSRVANFGVTPGGTYIVNVAAVSSDDSTYFASPLSIKASSGKIATNFTGGDGGSADDCIGDVVFGGGRGGDSLGLLCGGGGGGSATGSAPGEPGQTGTSVGGGAGGFGQGRGGVGGGTQIGADAGKPPGGGGGGEGLAAGGESGAPGRVVLYW